VVLGGVGEPSIARVAAVVAALLDGRGDDRVEDRADDGLGGDTFRLALEVEDDPVAERRQCDARMSSIETLNRPSRSA
jgi:hypothetical protein